MKFRFERSIPGLPFRRCDSLKSAVCLINFPSLDPKASENVKV